MSRTKRNTDRGGGKERNKAGERKREKGGGRGILGWFESNNV